MAMDAKRRCPAASHFVGGWLAAGESDHEMEFDVGKPMAKMWIKRSNGCWVDVFDAERFTGNTRRLHGPAEFPGLRIREREWGDSLVSLNVGPGAYVQCFDSHDFFDSVFWLLPNQAVESVQDLHTGDTVDSMRLYDRPPFA